MEEITNDFVILHTEHEPDEENIPIERETCRGIIVNNGKILLSHETVDDLWLIPGGGVEDNETLEECCVREIEEEMGYTVRPFKHFADVYLYFSDSINVGHFFECEIIKECERRLLDYEIDVGVTPDWIDINEAYKIYSEYKKYRETEIERYYLYSREYLALKRYMKIHGML